MVNQLSQIAGGCWFAVTASPRQLWEHWSSPVPAARFPTCLPKGSLQPSPRGSPRSSSCWGSDSCTSCSAYKTSPSELSMERMLIVPPNVLTTRSHSCTACFLLWNVWSNNSTVGSCLQPGAHQRWGSLTPKADTKVFLCFYRAESCHPDVISVKTSQTPPCNTSLW